ncbi:hypothetical protein B1R32_103254 [Abditibacterium utsteinense]|uniref:Uncharacterized protein n=1 Tax=Abditibacterium utsteinense TaxID=1960156 RepID=A0A2S8SW18_9BACT|nr:hypothetical protein [Abditibacterium utsteinense]PQV64984.1 hypothetical protein B1R32_103254 [Abditibacterium utsteinense]
MPGRVWTQEKLIAEIQRLYQEGTDLSPTAIQQSHSALFSSARSRSHFGSWRAAIEAAGLDYDDLKRVKQRWNRDEILQRIREMHAQGHDLLDPKFKTKNRSLYLAACAHRYFGSWRRAVSAAGLDHEEMRESRVWTRTRILRTIQEISDAGKPLGWAYIEEHEPGIYRAARRKENFGSWVGALQAAGVDHTPLRGRGAGISTMSHIAPAMMMSAPGDDVETPAVEPPLKTCALKT